MSRGFVTLVGLLGVSGVLVASSSRAQTLEPRAYSNAPVGLNFLIAGYGYSQGEVLPDPALAVEDANAEIHGAVAGYARTLDFWGKSGKVAVILPYAWFSGSATFAGTGVERTRVISGFADPSVSVSINFLGAPALGLREFMQYRQKTIVGASLRVSGPFSQYDPARLVNIGTNRWSFKPELGVSHTIGPWILEGDAAVIFLTDNDNFFGGRTREQDPIYAFQFHSIYNFPRGLWAAVDATYYTGGRSTVDGVEKNDELSSWRAGATLAIPLSRRTSLKFYGSAGVLARTGSDFDAVGVAYQYRWGGGI
jgi:Putative MetA-pathway of phenol degradation